MKYKSLTKILAITLAALMLLTSCQFGGKKTEDEPIKNTSFINKITPTISGEQGVSPDSQFTMELNTSLQSADLYKLLEIEPNIGDYTLEGSDKTWTLTPEKNLEKDKVYAIRALNADSLKVDSSFAFQTQADLTITNIYPANESMEVDVNAGIEITFNTLDVVLDDYFVIRPAVEGSFQVVDYKTTFVPNEPLEQETMYQVGIKKGLTSPAGTVLQENYSYSFYTTAEISSVIDLAEEFSSIYVEGDPIRLNMHAYGIEGDALDLDFNVGIYRYKDTYTYSQSIRNYHEQAKVQGKQKTAFVPIEELEKVTEYATTLLRDEVQYTNSLILPEELPLGEYLVDITTEHDGEPVRIQKAISVTDYSVYLQLGEKDLLVWVNSLKTKLPVENAEISVEGVPSVLGNSQELFAGSGLTGADGIAMIDIDKDGQLYISVKQGDTLVYFDIVQNHKNIEDTESIEKDYFNFIYTDRERYQPTDTLRFWGTVLPRNTQGMLPSKVWVELENYGKKIVKPQSIEISAYGTFSGEIDFSTLASSNYTIIIRNDDGQIIARHFVMIEQYEKPSYFIEVTTDKEFYHYNEDITFDIIAKYYDGTPVVGKELTLMVDQFEGPTQVILGASGAATVTGQMIPEPGPLSWEPVTAFASISNSNDMDNLSIYAQHEIQILPGTVAGWVESTLEYGAITIQTAEIDTSKLNEPLILPRGGIFDTLKGGAYDTPVTVNIWKNTTTKTVRDEYYDAVNKKTITYYDYAVDSSIIETIEAETKGGTVTLTTEPYNNTEDESFWVEAIYTDDRGISLVAKEQVLMPYFPGNGDSAFYQFFKESDVKNLALGDSLALGLYAKDAPVEIDGNVLYSVYQEDIIQVGIYSQEGQSITMEDKYIPNISLLGAYFDGKYTHPIYNTAITYDYSDNTLDLSIAADKEDYKPGETAKLTLLLTDQQGNPVKGSVCVGVVDESNFAEYPQSIDLMASLYQSIYYPWVTQHTSSLPSGGNPTDVSEDLAMGGAGMVKTGGGGMTPTLRKRFVDNALFEAVETDADGTATVEFSLPDNITSWRITALAVTKEVQGGDQLSHAVTTLPFYINTAITSSYLVGDDVVIAIDGVSRGSVLGESINYTIEVKDKTGKVIDTQASAAKAGNRLYVTLGKLEEGAYQVVIQGDSGEHKDAIQQNIVVVKEGLSIHHAESVLAKDWDWKIAPLRFPVEITAYDRTLKPYFDTVNWLNGQYSQRSEVQVANYYAQLILKDLSTDPEAMTPKEPQLMNDFRYVYEQGFYALPQGESDVATTAKVLAVSGDRLSSDAVIAYLNDIVRNPASNPNDRVMALTGLAMTDQPVLLAIQRELANNKSLAVKEELYLASGLAKLGDYVGALERYAIVGKKLENKEDGMFVKIGSETENNEATAAALLTLSFLKHPDASKLATYLVALGEDREQQVPYHLELLAFVQNYEFSKSSESSSVTFTNAEGKKETYRFGETGNWVNLVLNQEEFESKSVESAGNVEYLVRYRDHASGVEDNKMFTITKDYHFDDGSAALGKLATVKISLKPNADTPSGFYVINDFIPSGMRYVSQGMQYDENNNFHYVEHENQQVTIRVYYNKEENADGLQGSYLVSSMLPGEFVSESAVILTDDGKLYGSSSSEVITIK